jgi:1-acyl-sn-glycerol-3-phosphate acyltransferase
VYYPPKEERVSHFRPGKDFARISVLNTVLCFLAVVYGLPLRLWRWVMKYVRTVYALLFFLFFMFVVIKPAVWVYLKVKSWKRKVKSWKRKVKSEEVQENRWLHKLIYRASRFVMLTHGIPGVKFSYGIRREGVRREGKCSLFDRPRVVICNHQSHLDLFCQLIFTPNIIFLTNDWVWNNPSYGLLIRNAEYYPVMDGLEELLPKLRSLVERGYSIAVYPEGTRSKDCQIGRFHQGAFWLAEQLGVDILPMCLYGPGKILKKKTYTLQKGPVRIEVDEPVSLEELRAMGDHMAQAKEMRRRYKERYEALANRIEGEKE